MTTERIYAGLVVLLLAVSVVALALDGRAARRRRRSGAKRGGTLEQWERER